MGSFPLTRENSWSPLTTPGPAGSSPLTRENWRRRLRSGGRWGSSPLTRGKRGSHRTARLGHGLIPAHAGKTQLGNMLVLTFRAHPRSRGENPVGGAFPARSEGSSPLTRGKHLVPGHRIGAQRLIPAHAGKTFRRTRAWRPARAHPRSRGENEHRPHMVGRALGSSPLTRGKLPAGRGDRLKRGLIPAHAGKT